MKNVAFLSALTIGLLESALAQTPLPATPAAVMAQPELGRLFFTAAEREQRERERVAPKPVEQTAAPDIPAQVRINGYIARTGRPALPVVDGKVLESVTALSGLRISGGRDGRVRVSTNDGKSLAARPGQTLELTTGEITEWYDQPGRKRAAAAPPATALPYTSGSPPRIEPDEVRRVVKARKPRRGKTGKRVAAAPVERPPVATPAPRVAPAAAPAPAIPPAGAAPLVKP